MMRLPLSLTTFCALATLLLGVGCASNQPQSSRLTSDDMLVAGDKMKQSLAASEFLAGRTPQSSPVVVMTNKVENLTDTIIPVGQQWSTVLRIQNAQPVQELAKQRNVKFVVPPERAEMAAGTGLEIADVGSGLRATHVLSATFTSSARTNQDKGGLVTGKQDYYYLEFKLTEVQSRELVWSDAFEFKRQAQGILID